jgi:hypothetical protein
MAETTVEMVDVGSEMVAWEFGGGHWVEGNGYVCRLVRDQEMKQGLGWVTRKLGRR